MAKIVGKMFGIKQLQEKYPLSDIQKKSILKNRENLKNIISGKENKKILIIGPCSADFKESILEYAKFLSSVAKKVEDKIQIVMRFYTGKPRTTTGWKGLQNSFPGEKADIKKGLENSRKLAIEITQKYGLALADEMLHPHLSVYLEDIFSYFAIGARSVENQFHREVSSGMDFPIGMKNPTSGSIDIMINSIIAAQSPSSYVICENIYETQGNFYTHMILRGGASGPNYSLENIELAYKKSIEKNIKNPSLIVDCNHDNSGKKAGKQIDILTEVLQSVEDNKDLKNFVKGFMVESYLYDGRQDFESIDTVKKGLSLTDPCIGKENTEKLIMQLYNNI